MAEIYVRFDNALQEMFVKFPDKTTIAQYNKRQQEEVLRAEAESKRRYPIEQKERAEYAKAMLTKISFDINSYFNIQRDLRRFIYSASVTEKKWNVFKELQMKGDWLGMLNAMSEIEMKDYPAQKQIASIIDNLRHTNFHAEFLFTHKYKTWEIRIGYVDFRKCGYAFENPSLNSDVEQFTGDGIIVQFSMTACKQNKPLLYAKGFYQPERRLFDNRSKLLGKIGSDVALGKITQSEAECRREAVEDEFRKEISAWVELSKVPDGVFGEKVRERGANINRGNVVVEKHPSTVKGSSKPKWVACPDCGGTRYISKGRCDKCGGAGKYRTASVSGIGGRTIGGRMTQCDKCKGKGEIKELCKRCRGYGKIKQ